MSDNIYPFLHNAQYTETPTDELPLYVDVKWDDERCCAVLGDDGEPIICTGADALHGWIMRALLTDRYADEHYSAAFGSELRRLIGRTWQPSTRMAEARRCIEDCLLQNPYIKSVTVDDASLLGNALHIACSVQTVCGNLTEEVNV